MKYVCPHCHQTVSCKWYESKVKLQCKHCSKFVFDAVKQKLSVVSFISALIGILSLFFYMEIMQGSLLIRLPLLVITLVVLALVISYIEKIICNTVTTSSK